MPISEEGNLLPVRCWLHCKYFMVFVPACGCRYLVQWRVRMDDNNASPVAFTWCWVYLLFVWIKQVNLGSFFPPTIVWCSWTSLSLVSCCLWQSWRDWCDIYLKGCGRGFSSLLCTSLKVLWGSWLPGFWQKGFFRQMKLLVKDNEPKEREQLLKRFLKIVVKC